MQCRSHAAQLGRLYQQFQAVNFEVVLILGDSLERAKRYSESLHLPFPILSDPERKVYHQYGLEKTFLIQRTASVIIDCNGIIRYIKSVINPMTWLQESQEVLQFAQTLPAIC